MDRNPTILPNFPDAFKQIMELSEIREKNIPGWTRRAFTPAYNQGRQLVKQWMENAGLEVKQDPAANLLGFLPGKDITLPPLLIGSHTDTVLQGGRFDGVLGVVGGIQVAKALHSLSPLRGLIVVDFTAEEPTEFGISTIGSRAMAGTLPVDALERRDSNGRTLAEAIDSAGGDSILVAKAAWKPASIFGGLELHIEQGPVLESNGKDLGVVKGIVGIRRIKFIAHGRADHAGTTPMAYRKDALTAMAELVLVLETLCKRMAITIDPEPLVGTVGKLTVYPNAANVIPERVEAFAEIRSLQVDTLDALTQSIRQQAEQIGERRGVPLSMEVLSTSPPIATDPGLQRVLKEVAAVLTPRWMELSSGAGHDMNQISSLAPVGMLFVPCKGGRSHTPEEWCEPEAVNKGVQALFLAARQICLEESI